MIRHRQIKKLDPDFVRKKLDDFFKEDNISEDITTRATQKKTKEVKAFFIAKEDLVFAGKEIIVQAFQKAEIADVKDDGSCLESGEIIAEVSGFADEILKKERVVLNLLQRLTGIATTTKKLSDKLKKYQIQLLDTRKTTPGLREFEKFAVSVGGGINHRFS